MVEEEEDDTANYGEKNLGRIIGIPAFIKRSGL